jgi:LCP family protein required for cell wall assembly
MIAGVRAGWARLPAAGRFVAVAPIVALLGLVVASASGLLGPAPTPPTSLATPSLAASMVATTGSPGPAPSGTGVPASSTPADPLLGNDGRFTVLLLGSDFRGSSPGNRTDTIMIVSIAPPDSSVAVVSIPRDTARFPLPTGKVYPNKINALYATLVRRVGRDAAGTELRGIIGTTLGVEIDAYAFIGLVGLTTLIDDIGGVDVVLDAPVRDPYYWTNQGTQGISFPAGKNHLNGDRALIFARTRKGDSDFQRVRRQQQLVLATARKVLQRGASALPALVELTRKWVQTDLSFGQAVAIFELVANADLDHVKTDVLGPRYADPIPGTFDYELRMDEVRALIARWFAPVPGSPASGTGAPSSGPSTSP